MRTLTKLVFTIIEFFLGLFIGGAILWITVLALVKFTRRMMAEIAGKAAGYRRGQGRIDAHS
jgi:hypothetical protein